MKKSALLAIAAALAVPLILNAAPEPSSAPKIAAPKAIACDHDAKAAAGEAGAATAGADAAAPIQGDVYTLATDPVTGEMLPATPVIAPYEGRDLRFATKANAELFAKEPVKYLAKVDSVMTAEQLPFYPLETCLVSGEKLSEGDMGPPVSYVYNNRMVRLCCRGCIARLKKDPAKYLGALDDAVIKAQSEKYPVKTCVVTEEDLTGKESPFTFVTANRMVKLCCKHCLADFNSNPAGYLSKITKS